MSFRIRKNVKDKLWKSGIVGTFLLIIAIFNATLVQIGGVFGLVSLLALLVVIAIISGLYDYVATKNHKIVVVDILGATVLVAIMLYLTAVIAPQITATSLTMTTGLEVLIGLIFAIYVGIEGGRYIA